MACSASSWRPEASYQRGDSGKFRRIYSAASATTNMTTNIARHPSEVPMSEITPNDASVKRTTELCDATCIHPLMLARRLAGMISATSANTAGSSAPSPRPVTNRKKLKDQISQEKAVSRLAVPQINMLWIRIFLRPKRSDRYPAAVAPTPTPAKTDPPAMPACWTVRPRSSVIAESR